MLPPENANTLGRKGSHKAKFGTNILLCIISDDCNNTSVDTYLPDINAGSLFTLHMSVPEFCDHRDGIQTGIFSKGRGNHLHCLSKCPEAVSLHSGESSRVFHQTASYLDLWSSSTSDQRSAGRKRWEHSNHQI